MSVRVTKISDNPERFQVETIGSNLEVLERTGSMDEGETRAYLGKKGIEFEHSVVLLEKARMNIS